MKAKKYCTVTGCLNNDKNPNLVFFSIPKDTERRDTWLRLILREDLMTKNPRYHVVCQEHFENKCILTTSNRKILKKDAIPSLNLPNEQGKLEISAGPSLSTRKMKYRKSLECRKFKQLDTRKVETFYHLCHYFLTEDLEKLVNAYLLNANNRRSQNSRHASTYTPEFKLFCMNLFYTSPQAYRLLQQSLYLPSVTTIGKYSLPICTELNERLMMTLKAKVDNMTNLEKNCSVVVGTINLKTNLYYNISQDRIIGFHEVNGVQTPVPAKYALVVLVQSILSNWNQPIGFALLAESKTSDEVSAWIDIIIENLLEVGLNVRTFVSDIGSDLLNAAKKRLVSTETPYFFINDRKIFYIFDPPNLMKLVQNDLILNDFYFRSSVCKWEHILKFYESDKQKSVRLAPKLTDQHIQPTTIAKKKVLYALQLLSNTVAAGISAYVDFKALDESARGTVNFITKINNLFDVLNSIKAFSSDEYKKAFCGNDFQNEILIDMLKLFNSLKLINSENGQVVKDVTFIEGFQITIKSILLLFADLKLEGYNSLFTRRLNLEVISNSFGTIGTKNDVANLPTSRQFVLAFKNEVFANIIQPASNDSYSEDLSQFLLAKERLEKRLNPSSTDKKNPFIIISNKFVIIQYESVDPKVPWGPIIPSSCYNQLVIPEKNSLMFISTFLLRKSIEQDPKCGLLKSYSRKTENDLLITPPQAFVNFVEEMELQFRSIFNNSLLECNVGETIFKIMSNHSYTPPCTCFPLTYIKKLFIRMRLYYTIKFNNRAFRTGPARRTYFSICKLSFD